MRKAAPLALSLFLCGSLIGAARAQTEPPQAGAPASPGTPPSVAPVPSVQAEAPPQAQAQAPALIEAPPPEVAPAQPAAMHAAPVAAPAYPAPALPAGPLPNEEPPHAGQPSPPSPDALYMQLARVQGQLEYLKAERAQHRIGGPIAMMAAGLGTALVSGLVAFSLLETAVRIDDIGTSTRWRDVKRYDFTDNGVVNYRDENEARSAARAFGVISCIGLGVGIAGSVFFARRSAQRNHHKAEIAGLKQQKREMIRALRYHANPGPGQLQLGLSGSF